MKLPTGREEPIKTLDQVEREHILMVLAKADGCKIRAAKMLKIGKMTLYRKLKKWSLEASKEVT